MSGDPLGESGKLRKKVLGLRWDTEKDYFSVEVKVTSGEKEKGLYTVHTEDYADLSCPEASLPDRIIRRVLWRVAQSQ
jgi:hypothetical protein